MSDMRYTDAEREIYEQNNVDKVKLDFARRLKFLMDENDINLNSLSEMSGVNKASLSKYTNALSEVRAYNLIRLSQFFGVPSDYLLGLTNSAKKSEVTNGIVAATGLDDKALSVVMDIAGKDKFHNYDMLNLFLSYGNEIKHILGFMEKYYAAVDVMEDLEINYGGLDPESPEYESAYETFVQQKIIANGLKFAAMKEFEKLFDESVSDSFKYKIRVSK